MKGAVTMRILILAFVLAQVPAFAQQADVLHVESSHLATRDVDKTYHTAFDQKYFVATVGNRRYTLETLAAFGLGHLEIGSDYPVVKITDHAIKIRVTDKKGRETAQSLNIVDVSEVRGPAN
jgi:hypothetical protein